MKNPETLKLLKTYGNLQDRKHHLNLPPLFHVSPNFYEGMPTHDVLKEHILNNEKHPNGALGLWLSANPDWCAAVGPHVYEITLKEHRALYLDVADLMRLHRHYCDDSVEDQIATYGDLNKEFGQHYDVLYIMDNNTADGKSDGEIVVLNFSAIESKTWKFSYADIENPSDPHDVDDSNSDENSPSPP